MKDESLTKAERVRAVDGLRQLKRQLAAEVPRKTVADRLLLATWNIREFDSEKYGPRCPESFSYIAEIIDHFDLVAVQEVRDDLAALKRVQNILGGWWKYLVTDVTLGASGNKERLAFLFDTRKVVFDGLAGELVLPARAGAPALQFARTPFLCGFKAGWSQFQICTVHIYYGKGVPLDERRVQEIGDLAQTLAGIAGGGERKVKSAVGKRAKATPVPAQNLIVLGDFNIFNRQDKTFEKLTEAGFVIPEELDGSNLERDKHYDQIAYLAGSDLVTTGKAGVFDWQASVFGKDQAAKYADLLAKSGKRPAVAPSKYNDWRTYQMSDHLLLWAEFDIDFSDRYLASVAA
ncbi:MAG: endonuclease/exonuclease/phosphatase family protein [Pseudomonadota bacterium]